MASEVKTKRRFYLLKRLWALQNLEPSDGVWRHKQEAEPGTALPATFPFLSALSECGYTTIQDLDGADELELTRIGLTTQQASTVLTALADLT